MPSASLLQTHKQQSKSLRAVPLVDGPLDLPIVRERSYNSGRLSFSWNGQRPCVATRMYWNKLVIFILQWMCIFALLVFLIVLWIFSQRMRKHFDVGAR